LTKIKRF